MMRALIVLIALFVTHGSALAQSFNCQYARKPAEVAICKFDELGNLDEQMASLYYALPDYAREELEDSGALAEAARRMWLQL